MTPPPNPQTGTAQQARGDRCPHPDEITRVEAWQDEQRRAQEARAQERARFRPCPIHGPAGRILYGPAPYGYGPVCSRCRREWSRREGKPWESAEQAQERKRAEHDAMVAEVESLPPAEFYAAWEALRAKRIAATTRYRWEYDPDEYGVVTQYGGATPAGQRYFAMRTRVRRETEAWEANHAR